MNKCFECGRRRSFKKLFDVDFDYKDCPLICDKEEKENERDRKEETEGVQ